VKTLHGLFTQSHIEDVYV